MEPRQQGYFKIHSANIYFRIYGTGSRTLFFCTEMERTGPALRSRLSTFARDFKVVTMDSRGHGHSGISEKPPYHQTDRPGRSYADPETTAGASHPCGIQRWGNIVLEMMLNGGLPVESIVVAGANLFPAGVKFRYQFPTILQHAFYECLAKFNRKLQLKADIIGLMTHEPNIRPEQLRKITVPALVLAGEKDMIKEKHTKLIASSIPNSTLAIIPGASHFIFGKWADKVNHVMKRFLIS